MVPFALGQIQQFIRSGHRRGERLGCDVERPRGWFAVLIFWLRGRRPHIERCLGSIITDINFLLLLQLVWLCVPDCHGLLESRPRVGYGLTTDKGILIQLWLQGPLHGV